MDLLGAVPKFDLRDTERVIHSRSPLAPPAYVQGDVINSMIANGCDVEGTVINSVIGTNCVIEKGAEVKDSVLMGNTIVKAGAKVNYSIIDEDVTVGKKAKVGDVIEKASKIEGKTNGITVLGRGLTVSDGKAVPAGEIIDKNV